ncbi:MAG: hypothetical protein JNK86_07065 [Alphaproteobacteria bacterium]|nr:hypothetical protein [Alphaproteobacteria bacterium]
MYQAAQDEGQYLAVPKLYGLFAAGIRECTGGAGEKNPACWYLAGLKH